MGFNFWWYWKFQWKQPYVKNSHGVSIWLWQQIDIRTGIIVIENLLVRSFSCAIFKRKFNKWWISEQRTVLKIWLNNALNKSFSALKPLSESGLCNTFNCIPALFHIETLVGKRSYNKNLRMIGTMSNTTEAIKRIVSFHEKIAIDKSVNIEKWVALTYPLPWHTSCTLINKSVLELSRAF